METAAVDSGKTPIIEKGNFSGELCKDAARLLRVAMAHGDAYVINNMMVLKFMPDREAFDLGMEEEPETSRSDYGLRVGLCVQDNPPFKRGHWYSISGETTRRALVTAGERRVVTLPIYFEEWREVEDVAEINKNEMLLKQASAYAQG